MTVQKNKIKSILIIAGIILACSVFFFILTSLPYFLHFKPAVFSDNSQDWGAFGSFIAGLISIINLTVFIILTVYIAKLSGANSDKQVKTQKRIIVSQFRQLEINKLNEKLDTAYDFSGKEKKEEIINKYNPISIYLTNFLNQKQYLFPILKSQPVKDKIKILLDKYDQLALIVEEFHDSPVQDIELSKIKMLETKIQFTFIIKNELIEILQQFILDELEN